MSEYKRSTASIHLMKAFNCRRRVMEKYSVLMSVYYKENPEYLELSIQSMLNQTILPDEFIIVKDGPLTNELNNIIEQYKNTKNVYFNIIQLKENGGLGQALNYGIKACRNELIARMDSDDISLSDRCEKQLKVFENSPQLSIVGTQMDEFFDDPKNIVSSRIVPTTDKEIKQFSKRRSPFNHSTVMYRKSDLIRLGGYHTSGRKEDLELFIRMLNNGCLAENINESLLLYRANFDNFKRRKTWKNCSEYIGIIFKSYKKGYCGLNDLLYVICGQLAMWVLPLNILKYLNEKYLRKKKCV